MWQGSLGMLGILGAFNKYEKISRRCVPLIRASKINSGQNQFHYMGTFLNQNKYIPQS